MDYLKGIQRRVKEIELLRWVIYFLLRPLPPSVLYLFFLF
jgi:hypothetical protein